MEASRSSLNLYQTSKVYRCQLVGRAEFREIQPSCQTAIEQPFLVISGMGSKDFDCESEQAVESDCRIGLASVWPRITNTFERLKALLVIFWAVF